MTTCQHNERGGGVGAGEEDRKCGVRCCLGEGEFYIGFVEKTNHSRQLVDDQAGTCVVQGTVPTHRGNCGNLCG